MGRAGRLISNANDVDAIVLMNGTQPFLDSTFWYVSENTSGSFEGSIAVILKDGSLNVLVNKLEELSAKEGKGNVFVYETRAERDNFLKGILKDSKKIGMNTRSVSYAGAEYIKKISSAEIVDVSSAILKTVSIKDSKEVESIRKACAISSKAANAIPEMLCDGITEKTAASEVDMMMLKNGAEGSAFETIAAFGEASAEPHHHPSVRKLRAGDTALFDFGCKYDMYCSDLTRTVFFKEPDARLKRAYEVVAKAKEAGMAVIRDGVAAKDVDEAARNVIDKSEFKGLFIHSFGHGIGMDVHEGISVSHLSDDILMENMVVSAEPGIYIPGLGGIRIEDTVLVKKNGFESLTKFDQKFTVIQ